MMVWSLRWIIPDAVLKVWHEKRVENWVVGGFPTGNCLGFGKPSEKKIGPEMLFLGNQGQQRQKGDIFHPPCVEWSWIVPHLGNADKLPLDDTVSSLGK